MQNYSWFSKKLLSWHAHEPRELPWRYTRDAYKIWLREIILQQTRVAQGLPYYERFISKYPTVGQLAAAQEKDVLKLWQGLGYYSRARNLLFTARDIVKNHKAKFPKGYDKLLKLKGIGQYTAAAIASFAFDEPAAVVDGNVYRLLSRVFGIETPIDSTPGKKEFAALAHQLLDKKLPADYNQAIMNFGSTVCKAANPLCQTCAFKSKCVAFNSQIIDLLPVKSKKIKLKHRYFHFLVIQNSKGEVFFEKRTQSDIWKGLYQFPLLEKQNEKEFETRINAATLKKLNVTTQAKGGIKEIYSSTQLLSHQVLHARFFKVDGNFTNPLKGMVKVNLKQMNSLPLPRMLADFVARHWPQ